MNDRIWATMDADERNLRLQAIQRKALAAFVATSLATVVFLGVLPALVLGGLAAAVTHFLTERRMTKQLAAGAVE